MTKKGERGADRQSSTKELSSIAAYDFTRATFERDEFAEESTRKLRVDEKPTTSACVVVTQGTEVARRYRVKKDTTTIGRSTHSDVQLLTGGVSRSHARIEYHGDTYMLVDTNSTNGTWVNGHSIHAHPLLHGDRFRIGETTLTFLNAERLDQAYFETIYRLTTTDDTTGAFNQRYFFQNFEREVSRARRHQRPLSLLVVNVDSLDEVSCQVGHLATDAILVRLASMLQTLCRIEDIVARFGSGEFYILLPETSVEAALHLIDRLNQTLSATNFGAEEGDLFLRLSMGHAELGEVDLPAEEDESALPDNDQRLERLILIADGRRLASHVER